ncbi:two-component system, chemotaxis family, response regulator WspR [Mariprofundus ferrinatatus]|uniref:diguanylate cyclase n=1 Tax=Mariprofundus ferrinatatus TaxID=1921087 RepID=A0A2K8L9X1_9PROT|nr:diguanylate cyclase [Mariprofundus ferrinatatus]ATX82701.1 two-component system, chemotaxis family, response regulator WspR [Mariprofundus ferrinatatus]
MDATPSTPVAAKVPYKVLLVDDQAIIFEALRRMLAEARDIELHYCGEGARALQMAGEIEPDVILQDLVMPDVDGLMLVKFFRANPNTADIPIVVLSSKEEAKTKADAFHNGANDYLVKLPDQIEMVARLRYHAATHKTLLERNAALEKLKRISRTDGLTNIFNRRHFDERLENEFLRARRKKLSLAVVLLDVDHFKQFNDNYGHQAGDDCLVKVAEALRSSIRRPADVVARYGGEEFVVILPETDREGVLHVAERIRKAVMEMNIPHEHSSVSDVVTVSLGIAYAVPSEDAEEGQAESLVKLADQGLYKAKESGRNRVAEAA